MESYDSYKDCGVQWLGQIPSHWEIHKLSHFLQPFSVKGHPERQLLSVVREKGVIIRGEKGEDGNNNVIPEDLSGYKVVNTGNFVINKMKSWQGSYGVSLFDGIVSPAYFVYKLNFPNKVFFNAALRSKAYIPFFMMFSKGIRVDQWDLTPESLKQIPFFVPSPEEQEAIVEYLDKATSKIDEAIKQQQDMIDLLNERKQIIINQTVCRGLNPDVPMKDSGIIGIREIPHNWEILNLSKVAIVQTGTTPQTTVAKYWDNPTENWFTPGDFEGLELIDSKRKVSKRAIIEKACKLFPENTVFIIGIGGTLGKVAYCSNPCSANQQINGITFNERIYHKYGAYYLMALNELIKASSNSATLPILNQDQTKNLRLIVPPIQEQKEIVRYLDCHISKIDQGIALHLSQIEKLQERKQIIINEVITGKVKVS